MMPSFAYAPARTLAEAVEALSSPGARLHAGGTALLGCLRDGGGCHAQHDDSGLQDSLHSSDSSYSEVSISCRSFR